MTYDDLHREISRLAAMAQRLAVSRRANKKANLATDAIQTKTRELWVLLDTEIVNDWKRIEAKRNQANVETVIAGESAKG